MTVREHCEKAGGVDEPELSPALEHLWPWFLDLSGTSSCGFAPNPVNHPDIMAWSHNTGSDPTPWEVAMLLKMDRAWRKFNAVKTDTPSK